MASLADVSGQIMRLAKNAPKLDASAERELITKVQANGDEASIELIAAVNLRRVLGVANGFRGYGLPLDDLVQEGCYGVMLAARKYDLHRDVPFGAYARLWMKAEMQEFILRNWSIVRLPEVEAALFWWSVCGLG